jgi:hypothetical protein
VGQHFAAPEATIAFDPRWSKPRHRTAGDALINYSIGHRFGSKADICGAQRHVRFTPESGHGGAQKDVGFGPKADMCLYEPYRTLLACEKASIAIKRAAPV